MHPIYLVAAGVFVVLVGVGTAMFLMYHRLSRSIDVLSKKLPETADNTIAQIEALLSLQTQLSLRHALPPTRGWAASPDFLCVVMMHALRNRPRTVVECSSGVSTVVLARCAQMTGQGHVYSLENDEAYAEKTHAMLHEHGLTAFATVIHAPLVPLTLPRWSGKWYDHRLLPRDLAIDMLVIDGPPWFVSPLARYPAVPVLYGHLSASAAIFLDDAARPDETECVQRWQTEFNTLTTLDVPTCEKGCVALQRVRSDAP